MIINLKGKTDEMVKTIKIESINQSGLPYLYSRLNGLYEIGFNEKQMIELDNLHNSGNDDNRKIAMNMAIGIIRNKDIAEDVEFEEVENE